MSDRHDPDDARFRRLVADASSDAPEAPAPDSMSGHVARSVTDRRPPNRRTWIAATAAGIAAALVIALIVLPGRVGDDSVPVAPVDPTIGTVDSTVPSDTIPATTVPSSVVPPLTSPPESAPPMNEPVATTATTTPTPIERVPTVIAAVDGEGDAVLVSGDGESSLVVYDGPDPDLPEPEEGPGPNTVDAVALSPDGLTAYVGMCCEPIAGSILIGAPGSLDAWTSASRFGYAPAVSPDGRLLAIGQINGPAVALTEVATGTDLDVAEFTDAVGLYTPWDTMWLDAHRVVGLGTVWVDERTVWVAIPMTVDGDQVTVGETLNVNELLPASDDGSALDHHVLRFAGRTGADRFGIHVPGEPDAISIEFRLDGTIRGEPAFGQPDGVGEPARSIWYRPDGTVVWVDSAGALRRGDETFGGDYRWARPTDAAIWTVATPPPPHDAIDLVDARVFGLSYGSVTDPEPVVADLEPSLGVPTHDTGWQPVPPEFSASWAAPCFGPRFRTIWWDDFRITFEETEDGIIRVAAWSVGDPAVDESAPVGDVPADRAPSGVASSGVGVGATRTEVLDVVPQDGRIIGDEVDGVFVTGPIVTTFDIDDTDVVTGIGSGRLDCVAGPGL